jgi:Alpha/beta hydrolase domain
MTTAAARLEGPIAVSADSGPFHGTNAQPIPGPGLPPLALAEAGYMEEEYFVSGEAEGVPYRTSLLVRRPADPSAFSGVVLVETIHAAGAVPFSAHHIALAADGHGYAMVASQKVALDSHVKPSNPDRYASLDVPDPSGATAGPGMSAGATAESMAAHMRDLERMAPVSNAILSQVGALLKSDPPVGPFGSLRVTHLIMGGSSQTGGTTLGFIRVAHAGARMPDGRPVFDGYYPSLAGGSEPVTGGDAAVVHALGEGDIMGGRPLGYRRPDGDEPNDRYRLYEIVAASHVPTRGYESAAEIFPLLADADPASGELSQFPAAMPYMAAVHNLIEWVTKGIAPPRAERIETDASGEIVRDEHGNARGGVRLSYVDVPFATYIASTAGETMFQRMIGLQVPFSKEQLSTLYPTHDDYVAKVKASVDGLVHDRWIFPQDGEEILAEAEAAAIP